MTALTDGISVPGRNLHNQVSRPVGNRRARQTAARGQAGRVRELIRLGITHFRKSLLPFADNAMACRASANTPAGMIDIDAIGEGDIQDASRQTVVPIRD